MKLIDFLAKIYVNLDDDQLINIYAISLIVLVSGFIVASIF